MKTQRREAAAPALQRAREGRGARVADPFICAGTHRAVSARRPLPAALSPTPAPAPPRDRPGRTAPMQRIVRALQRSSVKAVGRRLIGHGRRCALWFAPRTAEDEDGAAVWVGGWVGG